MNPSKILIMISSLMAFVFVTPAFGEDLDQITVQASPEAESNSNRIKQRLRRKKPRANAKGEARQKGRWNEPAKLDSEAEESKEEKTSSVWLPDWSSPEFDWSLGPLVGFKYQSVTKDRISTSTAQSEIGIAGAINNVPLIPDNPGLYFTPGAGYAMGRVDGYRKYDETGEKEDLKYRYDRVYAGFKLQFFYNWYRHTLDLSGGRKIHYQEDDSVEGKPNNLFSASVSNDFAVLLLPFISTHYTYTYRQSHFGSFDQDPFLTEHDNWLHARMFFSLLSFYLDIGPGMTNTTEVFAQGEPEETELIGRVDYLKAISGLHLFWKLGANAHAKYVFNSTESDLGNNSDILLPDQSLYETPKVVMPEDSFIASTFIGATDIFWGLGLGWQYNIQVLNVSKNDDRERETTQDNGLVITYSAKF